MNLLLLRDYFTDGATLSTLTIDGKPGFYACEDVDRGLESSMPLADLQRLKVHGKTAIPIGRYRLGIRFSPKHSKELLYLRNVPDFQYIELHPGNTPADTEGCILPGLARDHATMTVSKSRRAVDWLETNALGPMARVRSHDDVWITVDRDPAAWAAFRS